MNRYSKTIIILISIGSLVLLFFHIKTLRTNSELKTKLKILKKEKIALLTEHESCLKEKEQNLKKELLGQYLDYMINLRNKIENGYIPKEKEISNFTDRSKFVVDNMGLLKLTAEETTQHLSFLAKMSKLLNEISEKEPERKVDN